MNKNKDSIKKNIQTYKNINIKNKNTMKNLKRTGK